MDMGALTSIMADIGLTRFRFPTTIDPVAHTEDTNTYDIQPVDGNGNVAPVLASSLSPCVPDYIVLEEHGQVSQRFGQHLHCNDSENQIKMMGLSCLESNSELQGVPNALGFRAPELLLEGQLSPKADIWSLGNLVSHRPLAFKIERSLLKSQDF